MRGGHVCFCCSTVGTERKDFPVSLLDRHSEREDRCAGHGHGPLRTGPGPSVDEAFIGIFLDEFP